MDVYLFIIYVDRVCLGYCVVYIASTLHSHTHTIHIYIYISQLQLNNSAVSLSSACGLLLSAGISPKSALSLLSIGPIAHIVTLPPSELMRLSDISVEDAQKVWAALGGGSTQPQLHAQAQTQMDETVNRNHMTTSYGDHGYTRTNMSTLAGNYHYDSSTPYDNHINKTTVRYTREQLRQQQLQQLQQMRQQYNDQHQSYRPNMKQESHGLSTNHPSRDQMSQNYGPNKRHRGADRY